MGLATQMIAWPDELCEGLARRGLFVVRFDNRDVGESTHLRNLPPPRLADIVVRRKPPPYSISDMAADVVGLLDGLGLGEVHLVGASMGGFIAQTVALEHTARVRTLTLMMTSTGSRRARPSHSSSGQAIICVARPMMSTTGGAPGSPNVSYASSMPFAATRPSVRAATSSIGAVSHAISLRSLLPCDSGSPCLAPADVAAAPGFSCRTGSG